MQAGFIGGMFSWKRLGLAEVGEKGKSKGGIGRGGKFKRKTKSTTAREQKQ